MIVDLLKDAILQNLGPTKSAPKNFLKRNCMLCHTQGHGKDTRNRFGIQFQPTSILMNCFNCGFKAAYTEGKELSKSFKFFLKQINVDDKFIDRIEFEIFKQKNQLQSTREGDESSNSIDKVKSLVQKWKPMDLPKDSLPIEQWLDLGLDDPNFLKVVNYALDRRIYKLDQFYWSPETFNNINQRLIIPYFYKNRIVGFTSRLCYDTDGKKIPKYFQQCSTDFVYNLDHQQDWARKYVIVTEGVLDAWVTDGVGTLGEIGQAKIDIINRLQKQVIVCPDRDKKGHDLVEAAIANHWAVSFPKWEMGIKDASAASVKYGRLLTIHSIVSSATSGKEKINVQWKISQAERNRSKR